MTIFMGIRTKKFVFGVIDTKITIITEGQQLEYEEKQPKINILNKYNISFATIGAVLTYSTTEYRIGLDIVSKINSSKGKVKPYKDIIEYIASEYKKAYAQQVTNNAPSIIVIFGYDPEHRKTFLYECKSPNFEPRMVQTNTALFLGANDSQYRQNSIKVFEQHRLKGNLFSEAIRNLVGKPNINLLVWAKETFDSVKPNPYVGYPLLLRLYTDKGTRAGKAIFEGDTLDSRNEFDVNLKYIK